jgi:hypothetical protein
MRHNEYYVRSTLAQETAMFDFSKLYEELSGRGLSVLIGLLVGGLATWIFAHWRRMQERQRILRGDARDTIVIHHHLVESMEVPSGNGKKKVAASMRIRSIGQGSLRNVVPNGHLAFVLQHRAFEVTATDTLISMEGAEGSFLLETLTNFICDRAANGSFDHDTYVMAPCCEPVELAHHQPITILLIAVKDLALFENWSDCKNVRVEHTGDGARVLTLMDLSHRFQSEQEKLASLRQAGKRTKFVETMYVLDLALDKRAAPIPTKNIRWGRFEHVLKQLNLE